MNGRIKQLAIESGFDLDVHGSNDGNFYGWEGRWINHEIETFTQLILRECYDVLSEWKEEPFPFDEDTAIDLIKKHFL
jgi:hypothetical protein